MKKGNITTLASILAIGLVMMGVGMGTMAYFSDTETSTGNTVTAGTMDLELIVDGFELTNIYPCKVLEEITVTFQNDGSIPGYMYTKVTYTDSNTGGGLTADDFAALIYVKDVTYQHWSTPAYGGWGSINTDELSKWLGMDSNLDGYVSLYEMALVGWIPYCDPEDEPLPVGEGGRWVITLHMADSLTAWPGGDIVLDVENNLPQADGIEVTFTALLRSSPIS